MEQKKKNMEGDNAVTIMCHLLFFIPVILLSSHASGPFLSTLYRYKWWLEKLADISLRQSAAYGVWNFSFNILYHSTQV